MLELKTLFFIDSMVVAGLLLFRWALVARYRGIVSNKLFVLGLMTPAVALFCRNIDVFFLYLVCAVAFNSRSRTELAGILLFLLPSMPLMVAPITIGSLYLLEGSVLIAMGTGALIAVLSTRGARTPYLVRYDVAIWALVALFTFMHDHNPEPTDLLREFVNNMIPFAGPYLLVSRAVRSVADIERILLRLMTGATIMAITACFQIVRRWVVYETYYQTLRIPFPLVTSMLSLRGGLLRTGGSMIDYTAGGLFLATMVPVLLLLRNQFTTRGFWVVMVLLVGGLLASQSRGAWVGAIAGLAFVAAFRGRWTWVMLIAGAAGAGVLLAKVGLLASGAGSNDDAASTVAYRQKLASRGMEQVINHPLLGQTPDQLLPNLADLTQGQHIVDFVNGHLFIAMAAGVPLFFVWCTIWFMPVIELWRGRHRNIPLAGAPAAIIIPAMVAEIFTSFIDRNLTWPVIGLGLAVSCLTITRSRIEGRRRLTTQAPPDFARPARSHPVAANGLTVRSTGPR